MGGACINGGESVEEMLIGDEMIRNRADRYESLDLVEPHHREPHHRYSNTFMVWESDRLKGSRIITFTTSGKIIREAKYSVNGERLK